ncbi:RICIN domain-containing protein [Streptomyces lasiicapitis]|uniref:RICIN domain-containing protein n=1 Tax=Streptomyces lasiicapitis TaxID=1923961 RepID=UPI0036943CE5
MKKRLIGKFAAAAALVPVLAIAGTGQAFAASHTVTWKNASSDKYLAYFNGKVRLTSAAGASVKWIETKRSDGTYTMKHRLTGKCLDSNSRGDVYVRSCNGGNYQKWREIKDATLWQLKNKATGRTLGMWGGNKVDTKADTGSGYQRWY